MRTMRRAGSTPSTSDIRMVTLLWRRSSTRLAVAMSAGDRAAVETW
jgi:hypothetical protein